MVNSVQAIQPQVVAGRPAGIVPAATSYAAPQGVGLVAPAYTSAPLSAGWLPTAGLPTAVLNSRAITLDELTEGRDPQQAGSGLLSQLHTGDSRINSWLETTDSQLMGQTYEMRQLTRSLFRGSFFGALTGAVISVFAVAGRFLRQPSRIIAASAGFMAAGGLLGAGLAYVNQLRESGLDTSA